MIKQGPLEMKPFSFDLNREFKELGQTRADYLVIAHPDEYMIQKIKASFVDQSMILTTIPQVAWDFGNPGFIDWEALQVSFNTLVLVGSSQGGSSQPCVEVCGSDAGKSGHSSSSHSFFERAQQANDRVRKNEEHFIQQLDAISQSPSIEKLALRSSSVLEGLFYRPENGTFCRFNRSTRRFQLLAEAVA